VDEIAFLMQISPSLVQAYQTLYEQYNTPEYQERHDEIIATVKTRGFRPSQLENEPEPAEAEKTATLPCRGIHPNDRGIWPG